MKKITVEATLDTLDQVLDFINNQLEGVDCPMKTLMQIDIAVEEIFVNIAHYAYSPNTGNVTICCAVEEAPFGVTIQFLDGGVAYNPLVKEDPDVSLSVNEREIGGLGIYMVKKSMDHISYEYLDGNNILTVKKGW